MRLRGRNVWILGAVGLLVLALAAPALAQSSRDQGARGLYRELCQGMGSMAESLAGLFGMSTDDLSEARRDGKTLTDLAEEKGISQDDVLDTMLQQRREAMQQAVDEGRLTQEQADDVLERMESRMKSRLDQPAGPGAGGCGGPGSGAGTPGGGCGGPGGAASGAGAGCGGSGAQGTPQGTSL